MSEIKQTQGSKDLELEVGDLAGDIVNKMSSNIAIRCNRFANFITFMLPITFFLAALGYVRCALTKS